MAHERTPDREQALVIVPTYNEIETIGEAARRLFVAASDRADLLVVDDSSPDGTAELVKRLAEGPHEIHLLEREGKRGLGTAYIDGFRWALERDYWAVVEMDADLSHDPADVPRLLDALENADLVIGSRYVPGGGVRNWGWFRRKLSSWGNTYARTMLRIDVQDMTAGFRAYRTDVLRKIDLDTLTSQGYGFQIELTRRLNKLGMRIAEVPITFVEREHGQSKMNRRIVLEALLSVWRWGLEDRKESRKSGER
jgi:dolichol-phosphate mannosyltransferase